MPDDRLGSASATSNPVDETSTVSLISPRLETRSRPALVIVLLGLFVRNVAATAVWTESTWVNAPPIGPSDLAFPLTASLAGTDSRTSVESHCPKRYDGIQSRGLLAARTTPFVRRGQSVAESPQTVGLTTATSTALLQALRCSENHTAWRGFSERYYPLVLRFARRLGLSQADAEDAAQETLLAFARAYQDGNYDREKGRLHDWLFGIARRQIGLVRRRIGHEVQLPAPTDGTGPLERIPDDDPQVRLWEDEWQQAVLNQCFREARERFEPKTFEAFELFARKGLPAAEVAAKLGITANAVFLAKHKVIRRIRELVPVMEDTW